MGDLSYRSKRLFLVYIYTLLKKFRLFPKESQSHQVMFIVHVEF